MAIKFGKVTRKSKFGKFRFGEVKDHKSLEDISKTVPTWKNDTVITSSWKNDTAATSNWIAG